MRKGGRAPPDALLKVPYCNWNFNGGSGGVIARSVADVLPTAFYVKFAIREDDPD